MMGKMTGASESAVSTPTGGGAAVSPRVVRKVVGYVVREDKLLVFTHDDIPLEVTGVQVPAGTIEIDEAPEDAVLREVLEERSEEHTSELQSRGQLVCRLLLET